MTNREYLNSLPLSERKKAEYVMKTLNMPPHCRHRRCVDYLGCRGEPLCVKMYNDWLESEYNPFLWQKHMSTPL